MPDSSQRQSRRAQLYISHQKQRGEMGREEEETEQGLSSRSTCKNIETEGEGRVSSSSSNTRTRKTVVYERKVKRRAEEEKKKKKTRSGFAIEDLTTPPHPSTQPSLNPSYPPVHPLKNIHAVHQTHRLNHLAYVPGLKGPKAQPSSQSLS